MMRTSLLVALVAAIGCGSAESGDGEPDDGDDSGGFEPQFPCGGDNASDPLVGGDAVCLGDETGGGDGAPLAAIEWAFELYDGVEAVHIRLTMNPDFIDNSYGETAVGWDRGHKFKDLVGSDHAELILLDADGAVVFQLKLDYLSEDPDAPCGYGSLGPFGGDGKVREGDEAAILGWSTSMDENLNERGYCEYTTDSPATDDACTQNQDAPDWDFRMVYDLWVARSAFDPAEFGSATMDQVHASPSKGPDNTVTVTDGDCPEDWCNDPDGCDQGECNDPDGCDPGDPGPDCSDDLDCPSGEFCAEEGHCIPIVN